MSVTGSDDRWWTAVAGAFKRLGTLESREGAYVLLKIEAHGEAISRFVRHPSRTLSTLWDVETLGHLSWTQT